MVWFRKVLGRQGQARGLLAVSPPVEKRRVVDGGVGDSAESGAAGPRGRIPNSVSGSKSGTRRLRYPQKLLRLEAGAPDQGAPHMRDREQTPRVRGPDGPTIKNPQSVPGRAQLLHQGLANEQMHGG